MVWITLWITFSGQIELMGRRKFSADFWCYFSGKYSGKPILSDKVTTCKACNFFCWIQSFLGWLSEVKYTLWCTQSCLLFFRRSFREKFCEKKVEKIVFCNSFTTSRRASGQAELVVYQEGFVVIFLAAFFGERFERIVQKFHVLRQFHNRKS